MIKNIFVLCLALVLGVFSASAKNPVIYNDINLKGHVICEGEHIPFANISIIGTSYGTSTDGSGHYIFNGLPVGEITFRAQAVGYEPIDKTLYVDRGGSYELHFEISESNTFLSEVVISVDRNEIDRTEAPVVVSSISPKVMVATQATTLSDGLNFSPGLRMENNCQNCGFSQIRMNGLEGPYTQILINSRPVFSGLAGVYGLDQLPANMIERIEVVRGGGSALFGGNAIAGTINIITADPVSNSYEFSFQNEIIGLGHNGSDKIANGQNFTFNSTLVSEDHKSGIFMFGARQIRNPWDANSDGFSDITKIGNMSGGFQAYYRPSSLSKFSVEYHAIKDDRRGGNKFEYLPHLTDIAEEVKHTINSGSLTWDQFTSVSRDHKLSTFVSAEHINRDSYYGAGQDPAAYGNSTNLTAVAGVQYSGNFDHLLFAPAKLIGGVENTYSKLHDQKLAYFDKDSVFNDNNTISNQFVNTLGTYIQNQWDFNRLKLLVGLRADNYRIIDNENEQKDISNIVLVPRANVLFDITDKLQTRLSYGRGYRAPQIFDEDLHIEASAARRIIHKVDPNLVEETSNSFTLSFVYNNSTGSLPFTFLAEGFYTRLNNPFANEYSEIDVDGNIVYTRVNASSGADVYGTNMELKYAPSNDFFVQLGATIQQSKYHEYQQWGELSESISDNILRTPNTYGFMVLNWTALKGLNLSTSANYTGKMQVPHFLIDGEILETTQAFFDMGFKVDYDIDFGKSVCLDIFAGVKNIFNSYQSDFDYGANRDAGYVYGPGKPRTIYFGVKIKSL